ELQRERHQQNHAQRHRGQVELDVRGDVGFQPPPAGSLTERQTPLRTEGRPSGCSRAGGQADLSLTNTLSLSRPVTGSLFCFWYARRALRVSAFITPLILPL